MDKEIFIQFGEWLPDQPSNTPGIVTSANNVTALVNGYAPFPAGSLHGVAVSGSLNGVIVARVFDTHHNYIYAGGNGSLYKQSDSAWANVTRLSSSAYHVDSQWEFTQFGRKVYATNGIDKLQAVSVGNATIFQNLTGVGAPTAAWHIATVKDFIFAGDVSIVNTALETETHPQRIQWCAINNPDSWTADAATLADYQDLPGEGGRIQKIVPGEFGLVFQERSIFRVTFIGSPVIFQFDRISNDIGTISPNSVVQYKGNVFFLSENGFLMLDSSGAIHPIGENKVNKYFLENADPARLNRVNGAVDSRRNQIIWVYTPVGGTTNTQAICYNYSLGKWTSLSWSEAKNLFFFGPTTRSSTYVLSSLGSSTERKTYPDNNVGESAISITTGDIHLHPTPHGKSCITEIRPVGTSNVMSYKLFNKDNLYGTLSTSTVTISSLNSQGYINVARFSTRFCRVGLSANYATTSLSSTTTLTGFYLKYNDEGWR